MLNRILVAAAWIVLISVRFGVAADLADWRTWRGPLGNGSVELGNYPVKFGADNYLWRTELPGKGSQRSRNSAAARDSAVGKR